MNNTKEKEPDTAGTVTSSTNNISISNDNTIIINCQEKIDNEYKNAKELSRKGKVVGPSVINALKDFAAQNTEFAQAIIQSDKSVIECINSTVKGCDSSISDLEVYRKTVQFYFEGADVHMLFTVDLGDGGFSNRPEHPPITVSSSKPVELNLDSLLDF